MRLNEILLQEAKRKRDINEAVESPPKRDVVDWSDVLEAGKKTAKDVHGSVDMKKLKGMIANAKKHKPDSTAAAIELVQGMLRDKDRAQKKADASTAKKLSVAESTHTPRYEIIGYLVQLVEYRSLKPRDVSSSLTVPTKFKQEEECQMT